MLITTHYGQYSRTGVRSKIETCELATEALKTSYEWGTTTALYEGLRKIQFDDRKEWIEEHTNKFELNWNRFVGIMSRVGETSTDVTGLGKGLKMFSQCDTTKADFVLFSLPTPFYANTVQNIRAKDYTYKQKLTEFVPLRSKTGRRKAEDGGSPANPIVLKTEAGGGRDRGDNGKRCDYCIGKRWKGWNHTEKECFTKKRESKKVKKSKSKGKEAASDEDSDSEGVTINAVRIGKTKAGGRKGSYECGTAATPNNQWIR